MEVKGERRVEKEEEGRGENVGKLGGTGYSRWRKDRDESKEIYVLIEGDIMGLERNWAQDKFPGIRKDDPSQLRP